MTPQEILLQLRAYEAVDTDAQRERQRQKDETMQQLADLERGRQQAMEKQRIIDEREAKRRARKDGGHRQTH